MKHMPKLRSCYAYQQYDRTQICNNIRTDLRKELRKYSISIHQPESKIWDCILEFCLNDKENKDKITQMVREYF